MKNEKLKAVDKSKTTPMMLQYIQQKEKWEDCILFYRLGDFYEMFFDDAILVSKELELALTGRDCGLEERAPMCGVPHHASEQYIAKLIGKGYKVAICDQVEDAALATGIVKREVVRVVTPGTITESASLDEKRNNYICSVFKVSSLYSLAFADLSTGTLDATMIVYGNTTQKVIDELFRRRPSEIICNSEFFKSSAKTTLLDNQETIISERDDDLFSIEIFKNFYPEYSEDIGIIKHAIAGMAEYLCRAGNELPVHMRNINIYSVEKYMLLDSIASKNLELFESIRDNTKRGSLIWAIDKTTTSMGGRMLRRWMEHPLMEISDIHYRQEAVAELKEKYMLRQELMDILNGIHDIERLASKISIKSVNPRELLSLANSLRKLPSFNKATINLESNLLIEQLDIFDDMEDITKLIDSAIDEDAPITQKDGNIIKAGYSEKIDSLRDAAINGKKWIAEYEGKLRQETKIKNLRIKYTNNFGYTIEISNANKDNAPDYFIRRQTLVNSERYITEELKNMEDSVLGAEQKLISADTSMFHSIREIISQATGRLMHTASVLATFDVILSFAELADREDYCKPIVDESSEINIIDGRHPVVEKVISRSDFVPNSIHIGTGSDNFMLLTGPNMGGKSTYMRQIALIVLMAQLGSFVPAKSAKIGRVDKIFTRVGASDDLASGRSTFMVEMSEMANIINNATTKSLLILDEIGRGTSTYDGLAIAWAVTEYLSDKNIIGCRTLFATHYHELTELESTLDGVSNFHVAVEKSSNDIVFLHKIEKGGCDDSYGIEVAKLAGVQQEIIKRAWDILSVLEKDKVKNHLKVKKKLEVMDGQVDIFTSSLAFKNTEGIIEELKLLDVQKMTPVESLNILYELSDKAKRLKNS